MSADTKPRRQRAHEEPTRRRAERPERHERRLSDASGTLETLGLPRMSDTLMCFAAPLFEELERDAPLEAHEYVLRVAQVAWNADHLPGIEKAIEEMAARSPDPAGLRRGIASLRERKRRLFPDDPRLVIDFRAELREEGLHLQAMSTTSHLPATSNHPDAAIIAAAACDT